MKFWKRLFIMPAWTLDQIAWNEFDRKKVDPLLVSLVKAACMVEHNSADYDRYLCEVFHDDPVFQKVVHEWAEEEVQHGMALRKWAELADHSFNFDESFHTFTTGYKLPLNVDASVRGSRSGELIARCVVETGTSSYYTAIGEYSDEPLLRAICARIAADELRHYKLFYTHLKRYLDKEGLGAWGRLKVALSRIAESEDDELAYAYYAAHRNEMPEYNHKLCTKRYLASAYSVYRRPHIDRMVSMVLKATGLKANGKLQRILAPIAWKLLQLRSAMRRRYRKISQVQYA